MALVSPPPSVALLLRLIVGVAAGFITVAIAHRASHVASRWALANNLIELHGEWFLSRFAAWAFVSLTVGAFLGLAFGRRVLVPAMVAAICPPIIYVSTFYYLFDSDWFTLVRGYWFESLVAIVLLPVSAIVVSRIRDA